MRACWAVLLGLSLAAATVHARGGDPLPGLTPAEVAQYEEGFAAFRAHVSEEEGLGPAFNGSRCYLCHRGPALGGQSNKAVVRFGSTTGGSFDPLASVGGPLLQEKAITSGCTEVVPP